MIKALLYDLDGVLYDGMALHEEAFLAAIRTEGAVLSVEDHRKDYAGLPTRKKLERMVQRGLLTEARATSAFQTKQQLTQTYLEQRIRPDTDRLYLLRHMKEAGLRQGCVTNCIKSTTYEILRRTELLPFLDPVITNEDVRAPKPSPEPYLAACHALDLQPKETLVFEDHDVGMTSAFTAGCNVRQITQYDELTIAVVWKALEEANRLLKGEEIP